METAVERLNRFFEALPRKLRPCGRWITLILVAATIGIGAGAPRVRIDESITNYFADDDPVKQAYDQFRSVFGGDEYVYLVYRAKDGDIFSPSSVTALKRLTTELTEYRLHMAPEERSPLDHIDEVKSLINVKYITARDSSLISKNFIGDALPGTPEERQRLRALALSHPDYPLVYLSRDCQYGGILIRTDFNARFKSSLSTPENQHLSGQSRFDNDGFTESLDSGAAASRDADELADDLAETEIGEYPALMEALDKILEKPAYTEALAFYPVGHPVLMSFFSKAVVQDMGRLMSLLMLLMIVVLWLLFRSFAAVVWPVALIGLSIVWILGIIGWTGIHMTAMLQVIVFMCITVGVADAVHILSGYLFFRNQRLDHADAMAAVMRKSGLACLLTSVTTAVGLFSLGFVPLKPIATFGAFAGIAVIIAFCLTVVLLPLMLNLWSPVSKSVQRERAHPVLAAIGKIEGAGVSRPWITIVIFAVISLGFLVGLARLKVDSNFVEIVKQGQPLRQAYTLVDDYMSGTANLEIMMDFKRPDALKNPGVLKAIQDLQGYMEDDPGSRITKTISVVNMVKESYKALNGGDPAAYTIPKDKETLSQVLFLLENANPQDRRRLVTDDYSRARIGIHAKNVSTVESVAIMDRVQAFIHKRFEPLKGEFPGLSATLTGNVNLLAVMLNYIAWAQIKSFGLALIVISAILFWIQGSFKAGLISLAPNLFPILVTFGLMGFLGIPLDADTLVIAPIIIGLAVDDTIHFMTHFKLEMMHRQSISRAMAAVVREAGQAIVFTSLILAAGFLVFLLSFHNGISRFGLFASVAVLAALAADLFFLPALCTALKLDFKKTAKEYGLA